MTRVGRAAIASGLLCLSGCAANHNASSHGTSGCKALAEHLQIETDKFTIRVSSIRGSHLQVRDYDQRIIDVLHDRSEELKNFLHSVREANDDFRGCSGKPLAEMRRSASEELFQIHRYLSTFQQALKEDPAGRFIDDR
jgi:hypothetical protein